MPIADIIRAAGGASSLAKLLHRHHSSILGWTRVPAEHVRAVARVAQIPAHEIRPDLYDPPGGVVAGSPDVAASRGEAA